MLFLSLLWLADVRTLQCDDGVPSAEETEYNTNQAILHRNLELRLDGVQN